MDTTQGKAQDPRDGATKNLAVLLPQPLHKKLEDRARANYRTLSGEIRKLVEDAVKEGV